MFEDDDPPEDDQYDLVPLVPLVLIGLAVSAGALFLFSEYVKSHHP